MTELTTALKDKVARFWKWFSTISVELLLEPTRVDLISQIDSRIDNLGRFDWEIGPSGDGHFYFAISPNLDEEKLNLTRQMIALAPECNGWVFRYSKPAKDWKGIWNMKNERGGTIQVCSADWQYILYLFDDQTFDMDILIDGVDGDLETKRLAVDIAITGYLGEEEYMQLIKNVQLVDEFGSKASKLEHIKRHIESIL